MFAEYLKAFVIGGLLCAIAQILIDKTKLTPARILVAYVCSGVLLGAIGVYGPLTGFGYLISTGVREAVDEHGLLGALSGPITAAAVGITASLVFSLIAAFIFKSRPKK